MNYLLVEDDCAPDARESFEEALLNYYGLTINDFKKKGKIIEYGYEYDGYRIEMFPDDRHWHLSDYNNNYSNLQI